MAFKIAIASGKGGTGKTTVATNLTILLKNKLNNDIQLVDCDVEEPNDLIFFDDAIKKSEEKIYQLIPSINTEACTFCRKCVDYCEFNAIVVIPQVKFAEVNHGLCHSCGACSIACQDNAIIEQPQSIGFVNKFKINKDTSLSEGRLRIGSAMHTVLIKELKKRVDDTSDIIIYDAPPGTSCPVVETINDTDYIVLVTEPTLFGLHDLKLMVKLIRELKLPFGVIVNKAGLGTKEVYTFLQNEGIELLGEIPFSKEYASLYSKGEIIENMPPIIKNSYENILDSLTQKTMQHD